MSHKPSPQSTADPLAAYRPLLSAAQIEQLETQFRQPLPSAIRINSLKHEPQQAIAALCQRYGWSATPVPYCPSGWQIDAPHSSQTSEYKFGDYYIQDAASMLPVELFDFDQPAPLVLDLAAAPGGKTTHLVSRTGDHGLVIANDSSPARLSGLRSVLQSWGAVHTAITHFAGELFGNWYANTFDAVLLDAPCSMDNLNPDELRTHRPISEREHASLGHRQLYLLASALRAARVGGQIVYATCTLAPEEDEAVLDGLLKLFPKTFEIEDVSAHLGRPAPGLSSYQGLSFDASVSRAVRLWPFIFSTSGFFTARLTKTQETENATQEAPHNPIERSGLSRLSRKESTHVSSYFEDTYGFDLMGFLEREQVSLWQRGELITLLPERFLNDFAGLPCFSLGLLLAEATPKGFTPSAEFAARFGATFTKGRYTLPEELQTRWLSGEDVPLSGAPGDAANGSVVIVFDEAGRYLGRGRVSQNQLKNLRKRN